MKAQAAWLAPALLLGLCTGGGALTATVKANGQASVAARAEGGEDDRVGDLEVAEALLVSLLQTGTVAQRKPEDDVYSYVEALLHERAHQDLWLEDAARLEKGISMVSVKAISSANSSLVPVDSSANGTATEVDMRDENSLLSAIVASSALVLLFIIFASVCGDCWPIIFRREAQAQGLAYNPRPRGLVLAPPPGVSGWLSAGALLSADDVVVYAGLDRGMFVEFTHLAMQILAAVGIPALCILSPVNWHFGAQGSSPLGNLESVNMKANAGYMWMHSVMVWYVVVVTTVLVFRAQREFQVRREKWLKEMPAPRATTVLVENIPPGMNTEEGMRAYFDNAVFGRGVVKEAFVVKDTAELNKWLQRLAEANLALERTWQGKAPLNGAGSVLMVRKREAEQQVERLREEIDRTNELNSNNAFVTFDSRREAILARKMFPAEHGEEICVSAPTEPTDVIWENLMVAPKRQVVWNMVAYALLTTVLLAFGVVVVAAAGLSKLDGLFRAVPALQTALGGVMSRNALLPDIWNGIVGPGALIITMSIVPSLLFTVLGTFLRHTAKSSLQNNLQEWYFFVLVVLALLTTAISFSMLQVPELRDLQGDMISDPRLVLRLMPRALMLSAHFFFSFLVLSWADSVSSITRFTTFVKYLVYRRFYDNLRAIQYAEPQEEDSCGIGARSAHLTFLLVVALTFCTLTPLISALAFVSFFLCRFVFAYLFVFAETPKPDMGGLFWITMLRHLLQGLAVFVITTSSVLLLYGGNLAPGAVAAASLAFVYWARAHFNNEYRWRWEQLQFNELPAAEVSEKRKAVTPNYKQSELPPPQAPKAVGATRLHEAMTAFQSRVAVL